MSKFITTKDRELPCRLTDDEVRNKGKELAQVHSDVTKEEIRQSSVKAEMKGIMEKLENQMSKLAHEIRNQSEERMVVVRFEMDDDGTVVKEIRQDTGEIINIRAPAPSELQKNIFDEK